MLSISLRQVSYACAIARHGGLTAAAQALNVSQPALSVALALVERHLGQPLFLRRPGGPMVPTRFGRAWLVAADQQIDGFEMLLSGAIRPGPLKLALFEDIAPLLLAPLLAATDPTRLTAKVMGFEALTEALTLGQADLAVTWDLGLSPGIRRIVLATVPPHAVLPRDHPLATRPGLTLAELAGHPLVLTDQGLSIAHMRALFARTGLVPRIAHRCASLDLMRSFAANGLGLGLSYTQPAPRHSPDGKPLVVLPVLDAGTEAIVLALPDSAPNPADLPHLQAILTALLQT